MTLTANVDTGIAIRPLPGESHSGDHIGIWDVDLNTVVAALVDGVGHGEAAHQAASLCISTIEECARQPLKYIIEQCHSKLGACRGVVMALANIDVRKHIVNLAVVGNVTVYKTGPEPYRFFTHPGIVGQAPMDSPVIQSSSFTPGIDLLFMASDGLDEGLDFTRFSRPLFPTLQSMAEFCLSQGAKASDDASVLVIG